MQRLSLIAALAAPLLVFTGVSRADVSLPNVIDSHMVLQRDMPLKVWGFAGRGEPVMVELAGKKDRHEGERKRGMAGHPACDEGRRATYDDHRREQ